VISLIDATQENTMTALFIIVILTLFGLYLASAGKKAEQLEPQSVAVQPKRTVTVTPEMVGPRDIKITTAAAKKLFRNYMLNTGQLDKDEIAEHVGYFADEMRSHEELLRGEVQRWQSEKEFFEPSDFAFHVKRDKDAYKAFKEDKRAFLVEYINQQQG
jgi:hypothetical protein